METKALQRKFFTDVSPLAGLASETLVVDAHSFTIAEPPIVEHRRLACEDGGLLQLEVASQILASFLRERGDSREFWLVPSRCMEAAISTGGTPMLHCAVVVHESSMALI